MQSPLNGSLTIGLDARAAAEVPAGRGRYMRELIRHLVPLLGEHRLLLYGRGQWNEAPNSEQITWRAVAGGERSWPLAAGRTMRGECDVALATSSYLMCAVARRPVLSMVWDLVPLHRELHGPRGGGFERLTLPIAVRRCASLIAISKATRGDLVEHFPQAASKTIVAYPAAEPRFTPQPSQSDELVLRRHGLRRPYVLVTGTLEPRKNLPRLIEAFVGLDAAMRDGWTLALAGADGWETDTTFSLVAAHSDLVRTLGFVPDEDLACLYRHAEIFCYVSLHEGFGIPVLEAMQCGTAVLTSSVSSMPEVGGDAARYVNPYNVEEIRSGLQALMADSQLREQSAAMGPTRASSFSWAVTAQRVLYALECAARG